MKAFRNMQWNIKDRRIIKPGFDIYKGNICREVE